MKVAGDKWQMIEYEIKMFYATYKKFSTRAPYDRLPYVLKNALEESTVLHTRILCEVFLSRSKRRDDIRLGDFLPDWPNDPRYGKMKATCDDLTAEYCGKSNHLESPCWNFNKRLAHPTSHRSREYDYRKNLDALYPLIHDMIRELESLTGRHFRLRFDGPTHPPALFGA